MLNNIDLPADISTPPQNIEAERAVLGAILMKNETIDQVSPILKEEDFYRGSDRDIYAAMLELYQKKEPVDIVTVTSKLDQKGILDRCGGIAYVTALGNTIVTAANAENHAELVTEAARRRRIIAACTDMIAAAHDGQEETDAILAKGDRDLNAIARTNAGRDFLNISDAMQSSLDKMNQLYEAKGGIIGISTGYERLDDITSGLGKSEFIIIAARPGMGKTSFALNLMLNAALRQNKSVAFFSLEMDSDQLCNRMACCEAGVSMSKIKDGTVNEEQWSSILEVSEKLSQSGISLSESGGFTVRDIRSRCRRLRAEGKLDMIIVDYIQLMESDRDRTARTGDSRQQEVSDISRGLKQLARDLQVPVIGLSQLSRGVENRNIKRPLLSDLRESGSLEQDADIVMFLYRESYYDTNSDDSRTEVIVLKNRNGKTGTAKLLFDRECSRFTDMPEIMVPKRHKQKDLTAPPISA